MPSSGEATRKTPVRKSTVPPRRAEQPRIAVPVFHGDRDFRIGLRETLDPTGEARGFDPVAPAIILVFRELACEFAGKVKCKAGFVDLPSKSHSSGTTCREDGSSGFCRHAA